MRRENRTSPGSILGLNRFLRAKYGIETKLVCSENWIYLIFQASLSQEGARHNRAKQEGRSVLSVLITLVDMNQSESHWILERPRCPESP